MLNLAGELPLAIWCTETHTLTHPDSLFWSSIDLASAALIDQAKINPPCNVQDSDAEEEEEESDSDEEVTDSVRVTPVRRRRPQPVRVKPADLKVRCIFICFRGFQT